MKHVAPGAMSGASEANGGHRALDLKGTEDEAETIVTKALAETLEVLSAQAKR